MTLARWETLLLTARDDLVDEQEVVEALRRAFRTNQGKWIAARAGVDPSFVSNVLAGRKRPSAELARILGYERVGGSRSLARLYRQIR